MRIIAIFLIMVTHACYLTFGVPTLEEIRTEPIRMFGYIGLENISLICVDVFILISGWFGIRPKIKSVGGLIFQCVSFSLLGAVLHIFSEMNVTQPLSLIRSALDFGAFINSYIVLCILAPVLNSFCEKVSKQKFRFFLLTYYG